MARQLKRFVEMFHGSSFPTRSETTDGETCVVKMRGAGNGAAALLSEFVLNRLAHAAGLPVPDVFIIQIQDGFPWAFGTDEFHDLVQKSPGSNLALAWLDGAKPVPPDRCNALPYDFVSQVVTLDLVFANRDRTARSGNLLEDRQGRYWIVDHGSCRFLFRPEVTPRRILPPDHLFAGRESAFDRHWLEPITPALVAQTAAAIPEAWLAETELTRNAVARTVEACLKPADRFGMPGTD
jgi:hypothetical protein